MLETWAPTPPASSTPEPPPVEAEAVDDMPEPEPRAADDGTAWITRPSAPDVARPVMASVDDFITFPPPPATPPTPDPEPTPEPVAPGLVDLNALTADAGVPSAPEPEPIEETAAPEAAAPEPVASPEPLPEPTPEPVMEAPADPEADAAPAYVAPEGAEDLTVITTIDEDVQRQLYEAGVLTLEEIAQWGRGDARRIGSKVQVSEDTIMNQWVFEAQAALFQRYSQQVGA